MNKIKIIDIKVEPNGFLKKEEIAENKFPIEELKVQLNNLIENSETPGRTITMNTGELGAQLFEEAMRNAVREDFIRNSGIRLVHGTGGDISGEEYFGAHYVGGIDPIEEDTSRSSMGIFGITIPEENRQELQRRSLIEDTVREQAFTPTRFAEAIQEFERLRDERNRRSDNTNLEELSTAELLDAYDRLDNQEN